MAPILGSSWTSQRAGHTVVRMRTDDSIRTDVTSRRGLIRALGFK